MSLDPSAPSSLLRWRWHLRGQVQGVGFRPFIHRIATRAGLTGRVLNDAQGVLLEVQGDARALESFARAFSAELPPLARVDECRRQTIPPLPHESTFTIDTSAPARGASTADAAVTIDTAVCPDCLAEMRLSSNRRFGHALINCTNCGPRFSIIRDVPYDRPRTAMAGFAMCPACRQEYDDPADRRFHAQPICCPACGPQLQLLLRDAHGTFMPARPSAHGPSLLHQAARLLLAGKILAIKGIGGFHLAARADLPDAVDRLRALKRRDAKPFALMCASLEQARALVTLSPAGALELTSPRAPIILAPRTAHAGLCVAPSVAPGTHLLPYTPLQHLLWDAIEQCLTAGGSPGSELQSSPLAPTPALVMTSGNLSDEPLVIDNDDARARLGDVCDGFLWHDRPIERCVDDSVFLDRAASVPLPIRRSRGYAPTPWHLAGRTQKTGLCVGGELKNTVALVRRGEIILSQHFGDLNHPLAYEHFLKGIDDLLALFGVPVQELQFVCHDLHPAYMSTRAAIALAARCHAPLVPLQHHVAHAAALLGEHHVESPAMVLVCDGTGHGTDGTIWGGELFAMSLCDGPAWKRLGRLRPLRLCGGDAAARQTRRCALALLHHVLGDAFDQSRTAAALYPDPRELQVHARMIRTGLNSPWTSSTGRLFDGIAALLGLCPRNDHEAMAPMALERAAFLAGNPRLEEFPPAAELFEVRWLPDAGLWELDLTPFTRWLIDAHPAPASPNDAHAVAKIAHHFHRVLAQGWVSLAIAAQPTDMPSHPHILGASGGSLCNQILEQELTEASRTAGLSALFHKSYPPTDAGLAFGQAIFSAFSR